MGRFDDLIGQGRELDRRARGIQGARELLATDDEIDRLAMDYNGWFARSIEALPAELEERFRSEYQGSWISHKIKHFFEEAGQPNALVDEAALAAGMSYWTKPYESTFRAPLMQQQLILTEAKQLVEGEGGFRVHLELLERMVRRLPDFLVPLSARHANRPPFVIEDEYDLQDLLHGLLSLHFDDVRPEDYAPERAGGRSRVDFVLKNEKIVVETKMTRARLGAKEVGEELIIDIERYRSHPDCAALLAVIYDPDQRIVNRRGLEADLSGTRDSLVVRVVIVR
jgi:hypothetical protein